MMKIHKHPSLMLAEAVLQMLAIVVSTRNDEHHNELVVSATHVGANSCLRVEDTAQGRMAWIFSRKADVGITLILGDREARGYDLDVVARPNNNSENYTFMAQEVYEVAEAIYLFFKRPTKARVLKVHQRGR